MRYQSVLFDLDGTLTDPRVGITSAIQRALSRFGIDESLDALLPYIGPPLTDSFTSRHGLSMADARTAVGYYREYFDAQGWHENEVYPGVPELLTELREAGAKLAVATSKPTVFAERILRHFELAHHFEFIGGSNLDLTRGAKAEVIAHVIEELPAFASGTVVMIGDREHDIIGARANGMAGIGAGYGFAQPGELEASGAIAVAATVSDLRPLLLA